MCHVFLITFEKITCQASEFYFRPKPIGCRMAEVGIVFVFLKKY